MKGANAVSASKGASNGKPESASLGSTTITINKVEIPVQIVMAEVSSLSFYPENPRIYSIVRAGGASPSQEDIFDALKEKSHVHQLISDIRENGGLIDPVIVRTATMQVLEGNSRLTAYRMMSEKDPTKWGFIKAMMLPKSFDDDMVFALLNQYHLKGKTKWEPFERAGFVYRRWTRSEPRISTLELSKECVEKEKEIKLLLQTYKFMIDHELEPAQWSHAYEFTRSTLIKKKRDTISNFDDVIVAKIKNGGLEKATDVRDKLRDVCKSDKILKRFLTGSSTLDEAYEELEDSGATSALVSRMKGFNTWFMDSSKLEARLRGAKGQELEKLIIELKKLCKRAKRLEDRYLKPQ